MPGATWVWPSSLDGVQAGDETVVYAELPEGTPLKVRIGDASVPTTSRRLPAAQRPLLERAWAKAKIESLMAKHDRADGKPAKDKLEAEIVRLSSTHRVLSAFTALLILETADDYARYGLDRKALSDILTVEDHELRLAKREPVDLPSAPSTPVVAMKKAETSLTGRFSAALRGSMNMISGAAANLSADAALADDAGDAFDGGSPAGAAGMESLAVEQEIMMPRQEPQPSAGRALTHRRSAVVTQAPTRPAEEPLRLPARGSDPYTGRFKTVMDLIAAGRPDQAAVAARSWLEESPGDVLALTALGEAFEAAHKTAEAARAYGSIIDLFPARADLRRYAGARLECLSQGRGLELAIDDYRAAVAQRPDHPHGHRLLAFALLKAGRAEEAFAALEAGLSRRYPEGRFRGATRVLGEDLGLLAAAWIKAEPGRKADILARLKKAGGTEETGPSLRFVLNWETDANDVDFHIFDGQGHHAFYQAMQLATGGELYADVTTGYGPECFTIRQPRERRAGPYTLQAHYYSRGPMGYGMGKLEVIEHDGRGGLTFDERPYVVMTDQAFVDLGTVR